MAGEGHESKFCFVDVHHARDGRDGKTIRTKWRRVHVRDVDAACRNPAGNYNCFATVQRFEARRHEKGERVWMELYFDFDGEREQARGDASKVVRWFIDQGLHRSQVRIWFSGNRGFHVLVDPYAIGARPSSDLHRVYKAWGSYLVELLGLTTLDMAVYSVRRMWRLVDSIHQKSGLFKVELALDELERDIDSVLAAAAHPRGSLWDAADLDYAASPACDALAEVHAGFLEDNQNQIDLERLRPQRKIKGTSEMPACVRFLLGRQTLPIDGTRNRATMTLASWYKDTGKSIEDALAGIEEWAVGVTNTSIAGNDRALRAQTRSTVRTVYGGDYSFACAFARALGSPDDRVACDHRNCLAIESEEDQRPAKPIECHLSEASRACYHNLPIAIETIISGKDVAPYIVPRRIGVSCKAKADKRSICQQQCDLAGFGGNYETELAPDDPVLMEFVGCSARQKRLLMRTRLGIPKNCHESTISDIESYNIEDVRLIPAISEHTGGSGQHAVRRGFHIGHGIETNTPYRIIARTRAEPRSQYAVHTFHEAAPLRGDMEAFDMTPQLREDLTVFQCLDGQPVWDKFEEIHTDLEANVTHIWQRRLVAFALDACWHSVIKFPFHEAVPQRGWVEVFVLGDSGQGKTEIVERLREWYGVGEIITGEDAGRTGLTYSIQSNERRWFLAWGVVPLNDRRLVVIDEFSGLNPEEFEKMSGLRSSGILRVHKVISDTTFARTRLIYLSNPNKAGRSLGTYAYGVEALKELIPKPEDIRRLDLVVAVRSGEVPIEVVNRKRKPSVPNVYTSDLCRQLILWAWSRAQGDVEWTHEATIACLDAAGDMGTRYWHDPPIVEPADQRIKIARIATAAAARVFSTPDGKRLVVEPEHVEFAVRLMDACYAGAGLRYDLWSRKERFRNHMDVAQRERIRIGWEQLPNWHGLAVTLLNEDLFTRTDLEEQIGLGRDDATRVTKFLCRHRLVEKRSRGYVKTHGLIEFLHGLVAEVGDDADADAAAGRDDGDPLLF